MYVLSALRRHDLTLADQFQQAAAGGVGLPFLSLSPSETETRLGVTRSSPTLLVLTVSQG
jgi:hypothetical protein